MSFKFNPFTGQFDIDSNDDEFVRIERTLLSSLTIETHQTVLHRDTRVPAGLSITIKGEGELYVI